MTKFEICSLIINGLIAIAGFSAIFIYKAQKRDKIKTAATIVISQIDFIENVIKDLRSNNVLTNEIVYRSRPILDDNAWSQSKYLLSKRLGGDNVRLIENFYAQAEDIEKSRRAICHELVVAREHKDYILQEHIAEIMSLTEEQRVKALEEFNDQFESNPKIFSPNLPITILVSNLSQFRYLLGTSAYEKLRKISYHS